MQKKIIVLAIAAALTAPALALADTSNVNVYGQANVSYDFISTGTQGNVAGNGSGGASSNRVSSNFSFIGVKGSEDLGEGMSAIWQVESLININGDNTTASDGANTFASRNTFAGLSWMNGGTVRAGNQYTPYAMSTRNLDAFADGIADNRSLMGLGAVTNFDSIVPQHDVLAYLSPNWSGFSFDAAYINGAQNNKLGTDVKATATSLAGMYDMAPFYATVAYESHNISSGTTNTSGLPVTLPVNLSVSEHAEKLGLGYMVNAFDIGFAYEKTSDDLGNLSQDQYGHHTYYLSGKYNISGTDAIKAAYTKLGETAANEAHGHNDGATQISLGYDHAMSKRTTVYALYTRLQNSDYAGYSFATTATSGNNSVNGVGGTPHALSVGLKLSF